MNQFFATKWNPSIKPANKSLMITSFDMQNIPAILRGNFKVMTFGV